MFQRLFGFHEYTDNTATVKQDFDQDAKDILVISAHGPILMILMISWIFNGGELKMV